jgi:Trypsin-like peptidase domain
MQRLIYLLLCTSLFIPFAVSGLEGQRVAIQGASNGQAILHAAAGQCYAITPRHVVEGSTRPVEITDAAGKRSTVIGHDALDSIAIMRIRLERDGLRCGTSLPRQRSLDRWLQRGRPAFLSHGRINSRVQSNTYVNVVDWNDTKIYVSARDPVEQIIQGMSGSPLFDDDGRLLGILLNVVEEGERSSGEVLRVDHLDRILESYLDEAKPIVMETTGFSGFAADGYLSQTGMWGLSAHTGKGLSRDLALVFGVQFATSDNGRLRNASQNDTASVWAVSAMLGPRIWLTHGERGIVSYVQGGGIAQFESKAAYDSIFGDYTGVGAVGSAGIGVTISRFMLFAEFEGQLLWITPQREREIVTTRRTRDNTILRLGFTRFWGSAPR